MLRFFRLIRRKLIEEENARRYFYYALGEIFLVVIGILIALQINNWNEQRLESDREQQALENLFDESEAIVFYFKNEIGWIQKYIDDLDASTSALFDGTYNELAEENIELSNGLYPTPFPPRGVYDELSSAGQFKEIKSDRVKLSIIDYYRSLSFLEGQLDYFRSIREDLDDFSEGAITYVYDPSISLRKKKTYDLSSLAKNEAFKSALVDGLRDQIQFQRFRQNTYESAVLMCEALAAELNTMCTSKDLEVTNPGPDL